MPDQHPIPPVMPERLLTGAARRPASLVSHPAFRRPGFGHHHPLATMRQAAVLDLCEALGWIVPGAIAIAPLPARSVLERFHTPAYLDAIEEADQAGVASPDARRLYGLGSMECPVFPGLWERARASVGGSILASELALAGRIAFHPGGGTHHGQAGRASGFCYLNDPVFAILRFLDAGLTRVLYVDLDAHHGDGVEDAFAQDGRVRLISIHEQGRWPGTGALGETRDGVALNMPVPRGFSDAELALLLDAVVLPLLAHLAPEAVVITFGADGLAGDPLSGMQLSNRAMWLAVQRIVDPVAVAVVLGGGGYNPWTTARLWAGLWGVISGHVLPGTLPPAARDVLDRLDCDLIDDDDRQPHWRTTIIDPPEVGAAPVRASVRDLAAAAMRVQIRRWT